MLVGVVFWTILAATFLAMAIVALRARIQIKKIEHPFGGMPHVLIPTPVANALRHILVVESLGFLLAAAAAGFEAFA